MNGKIKKANSAGYGFIETDMEIDFFIHHSNCNFEWKQMLIKYVSGEKIYVEFENDTTSTEGPRAINVKIVKEGHP